MSRLSQICNTSKALLLPWPLITPSPEKMEENVHSQRIMMEGNIASFLLKKKGEGFFHKLFHRPPPLEKKKR